MPHLVSLLLFICLSCVVVTEAKTAEVTKRPNILIVMVDDMGFSDLGCYGEEIETPVMDKLAANGLRFTQFYNTSKCHSSPHLRLRMSWPQGALY
jgi:arylsulfatase